VSFTSVYSLHRIACALGLFASGFAVSGCAVSTQLGPIFGVGEDAVVTGAITPRDKRFSSTMTQDDWTRAQAALASALGAEIEKPVSWDNPQTGLRGTVAPVATAYAADAGTCHAFVASLVEGSDTNWYQGRACRTGEEPWTVVDSGRWEPPVPGSAAISAPAGPAAPG
jgi:surface antigen